MKKIVIFILLFVLAGCAQNNLNKINEKNVLDDVAEDNEFEILGKMNATKNDSTTQEKTSKDIAYSNDNNAQSIDEDEKKQMKNLLEQFNQAIIKTNFGDIKVEFYNEESPKTVNNFLSLAQSGFYDKTKFHRVIKDFMVQGGDPNSKDDDWSNDGMGGPEYKFEDEINAHKLVRGSLAMANSGPDTNGSQFFVVTAESTPWLDGKHTNFGYVIDGMDVVAKIEDVDVNERDHPTKDVVVNSIELKKEIKE